VQDRIHLRAALSYSLGPGRFAADHNYSLSATSPGTAPILTDKPIWLPQYAITFNPVSSLTLYGNYGVLLSLVRKGRGGWIMRTSFLIVSDATGRGCAKYEPGQRILLTTALFHMRAPFFYPKVIQAPDSFCTASEFSAPGDLCFESEGARRTTAWS